MEAVGSAVQGGIPDEFLEMAMLSMLDGNFDGGPFRNTAEAADFLRLRAQYIVSSLGDVIGPASPLATAGHAPLPTAGEQPSGFYKMYLHICLSFATSELHGHKARRTKGPTFG